MSYFPEDIPYMSKEELRGNGIRIPKDAYAEHEKAQLSSEVTTSDLISRTETVEHLRRVLDATVPITDYDEGYVDGVEFGISTVSTMPTIQPQSTTGQLNDGAQSTAQSTDLIDRQQAIDALSLGKEMLSRVLDDIDVVGTDREKYSWGLGLIESYINDIKELPSAQPEPKEGEWVQVSAQKYFTSASYFYRCSVCGENNPRNTKYCPNCGSYNGGGRK